MRAATSKFHISIMNIQVHEHSSQDCSVFARGGRPIDHILPQVIKFGPKARLPPRALGAKHGLQALESIWKIEERKQLHSLLGIAPSISNLPESGRQTVTR